ncbi:Penicillinase repressor [Planctomycetes bacterium Poly30]|uniref:Penicillinase repressor n=1 Tax=Saltatorellus ferox TaxID=2528018 RepID=A0A518ETQ6_9BACT|nr:Penicillinase repressor [Planctomycetes bacterium Poly30]
MSPDPELRLTSLQLAVLRVLWRKSEASVNEVHAALQTDRPLATTTVATLLKRLEARGVLTHRTEGRQFLYRALVNADEVGRTMTSELVEDVYAGDVTGLFAHLLDTRSVSEKDLAEIQRMIQEHE